MAVLACPRCAAPLAAYEMATGTISMCAACSGHWLDNVACQRIVLGELPDAAHDLLRPPPSGEPQATASAYRGASPAGANEATVRCPECSAALVGHRTEPERVGVSVRLDACGMHGTWFDRGEAWALFQAVSLKRASLDYELTTAAGNREWAAHERSFQTFLTTSTRRSL